MAKRNRNCIWRCGRQTKNISRICDECWKAAEPSRSSTGEGLSKACIDLRPWAKANRYRWRWEESRQPGEDDAFLVEILCQRGLIYPKGGSDVLAFTTSADAWKSLLEIGVKPKRVGEKEREGQFPIELLDQVAAILKPRKRRTLEPDKARAISGLKTVHAQSRKSLNQQTISTD
jgi:hypothetical protein